MAKCLINHRKSGWWYINPSEKSWSSSQLGWWNSQYMVESHKIHVPNHQPAMASPKSSILIGFSIANYPETIDNHMPICSMYSIFTYMWLNYRVNVGKYSSTMEHMGYIVIGLLFTNFQRSQGPHRGPTGLAPTYSAPLRAKSCKACSRFSCFLRSDAVTRDHLSGFLKKHGRNGEMVWHLGIDVIK